MYRYNFCNFDQYSFFMTTNITTTGELLYLRISGNIEHKLKHNVLKVGDKLPSLRTVCREHGVSMSTATQAYLELEKKGLIESRPQSGYYVCYSYRSFPAIPATSNPVSKPAAEETRELISKVYNELGNKQTLLFSLGVPAPQLLPIPRLNKSLTKALRTLPDSGTGYGQVEGNAKLRRQIARSSFTWQGKLEEEDIITTAGCINAIAYCLMALTEKGDTIAVESPAYFGILQLAQSKGLNVLELPTHPQTGIELDALENAFKNKRIKVCLLMSNFSNPLGSCMPAENKREAVRLAEKYNVPIIEDDLYGDVYFGNGRPVSCKTFDESGMVLWCNSISKTLAPGYRVGWVAPGRFKDKIKSLKMYNSISSGTLEQEAVADFLENGRYEHHLRKMRQTLHTNSLQYIRAISEYFPEDTRVSRPEGGFMLWIELDKHVDTTELYDKAMRQNISIAPGRMFTMQQQYNNCMRLSYGLLWNNRVDNALKYLGRTIKTLQ